MTPQSASESTVDINVPRFNQAVVAALTALGFVLQQPWLVVTTFVVLALSWSTGPGGAPLTQLYVRLIRPRIQPDGPTEFEPASPPRFAQMLGTVFLGAASFSLVAGWAALGWALTVVVTALAALAATTRICVGCMLYERTVAR